MIRDGRRWKEDIRELIYKQLSIDITRRLEILSCKSFESLGVECRFEQFSQGCELPSAFSSSVWYEKGYLDDGKIGGEGLPR